MTTTVQRAYQIADTFRRKGVKVVMGGGHPSAMPEEAGLHADAVVIGEAEGLWPQVLADFKKDRLQKVYRQTERPSLVNLPVPRRDLFAKNAYQFYNTISTTRGCPFACSFCSVTAFFGHTFRCRPVDEIVKEIKTLEGNKFYGFIDDNLFGNRKFASELIKELRQFKGRWVAAASLDVAKHEDLLKQAAAAGCIALLLGFETISPANLTVVGKKANKVEDYEAIVKKIHSHGIAVHGFFILGLDEDDETAFERTVSFAKKIKLETASFSWPVPYPGTAFYDSLGSEGRITTKDWSQYEVSPVFEPRHMSQETLKKGIYFAWREFYSVPSTFTRVGFSRRNSLLFWGANLALRSSWKSRNL